MSKCFSLVLLSLFFLVAIYFGLFIPIQSVRLNIIMMIIILTIGFWASGIIPEYLTALIFFTVIVLFNIVPSSVIFSGFTSSSLWFIFAGLIISTSIKQSGLGEKISFYLTKLFRGSYTRTIFGIVFLGIILSFAMPSAMGRIVLIAPIAAEFAKRSGYNKTSKGYSGIVLAGVFGSYFAGSTILPANIPNMILTGIMESLYHKIPSYGQYFLLHFPVLGLLKALLLILIITKIFNDKPITGKTTNCEVSNTFSGNEKRMVFYLVLSIVLWMTDFIHHISPAWIGLAVSVLCLCPFIGVIDSKKFIKNANFSSLFYVAGIIGLSAVISSTGIGEIFARKMLTVFPFVSGHNFVNFSLLSGLSTITGLFTTFPGVPAILTPLAKNVASITNLPITTILMTQVLGFSTLILPYQAPPIIVAMQLGEIKFKEVTKLCLITGVLTIVLLFPIDYLWWHILKVI